MKESRPVLSGRLVRLPRWFRAAGVVQNQCRPGRDLILLFVGRNRQAALLDGICQLLQDGNGLLHADAGVGDGDAMRQLVFAQILATFLQVAFDHDAGNAHVTCGNLAGNVGCHVDLLVVLLAAVGVREVDHDLFAQAAGSQLLAGSIHMVGVVIGGFAATQNDMAVMVAACFEYGCLSHFGHAHKGVGRLCGHDGIHGDFDVAVGAVFEAYGAAQAAG